MPLPNSSGRTLQHFDLVGQERLDAGGMVGADRGGVHVAHAIGQHGNARAFLAADDRAADAGAEEGALYAGQLGHGIARVPAFCSSRRHRPARPPGAPGFGIALQRRRGDLHQGEFGQVAVTVGGVRPAAKATDGNRAARARARNAA